MLKRDKIKLIVVSILVSIMAITYFLFGKESVAMKSAAGFSLASWLITMVYVNKKYK